MKKEDKEFDLSDVIGGTLNIFGLNIDLAKLLSSPEDVKGRLEELREKLKQAGGKEVISDQEWKGGGISVSGHLRTRGILGEREYHIGTGTPPGERKGPQRRPVSPDVAEPPVDIFQEAQEVVVIAEVPGIELADLELKVESDVLSISTKPTARRSYRKEIGLGCQVDGGSLKATCRNGIVEIRLKKRNP